MIRIWDFKAHGDRPAFKDEYGNTVTYQELEELSEKLSALNPVSMDSNSQSARPLVVILCRNTIGSAAGYAALLESGYPVMPISEQTTPDMVRRILITYKPAWLLVPSGLRASYSSMKEVLRLHDEVLLRTNFAVPYPVHPELARLLTTSGTTGSVKFVRQSWENVSFNARAIADYLGITSSDRTITALPMQYTYGLSIIDANLMMGAVMIVTHFGIMDEEFWDLFEEEESTSFHGVPNTYDMLRRLDMFSSEFPHLKTLTQAGGKLSRDLHEYYAQYAKDSGKRFIVMYGQCEATAAISYLPAEESLSKIGSVGKVIPGGELLIINENGEEISAPRTQGELIYKGLNVALGYAVDGSDLAKGDEWQGTLRTGDVGETDEDGFYYITGRLKRFIKIMGHRLSLDELDSRIMEKLYIESASTGVDDHLVIFVTGDEDRLAVLDYVRNNLSTLRTHIDVIAIEAFPRNESGKIKYGELLKKITP